jgi:hypothetical protein
MTFQTTSDITVDYQSDLMRVLPSVERQLFEGVLDLCYTFHDKFVLDATFR